MKAIAIQAPRRIVPTQLPSPGVGEGDVLLRVLIIGLCGSDLSTYRGLNPLVTYPRVPGHEIGAVIERCGAAVPSQWQPGMIVTCSPYTNCGQCSACKKRRFNACQFNKTLGVQRDGALTELLAVPWQKLLHAPGLSAAACAMIEPLAVGFHAASLASICATDTVLVIGTGVVGLGAISRTASLRASRVIAVDLDNRKLDLARKAGATDTINSATDDLHHEVAALTEGRGVDVVIEAVGSVATSLAAIDEVCYAGRVVYVGYTNVRVAYETKVFMMKELEIRGSRGSTPADFQNVVEVLQGGAYPIEQTITRTVYFDQVATVMAEWDADPAAFTKVQVQVCD